MTAHRMYMNFGRLLAVLLAGSVLFASEHHGVVQSGGLPVPGATVTATQGDKKFVTTTDDQGTYAFADLPDGVWTITVEMLGFAKLSEDVGVAAAAPSPTWNLKLMSAAQVKQAVAALKAPAPTAPAAPVQKTETKPVPAPATSAQAPKPAASQPGGGRGNGNGGNRPSIRSSLTQNGQGGRGQNGFQRMDVNASEGAGAAGMSADGAGDMSSPDLAQSANDAFVVGGSISSGVAMPQENDWFGGRGPGGMGFGPGMGMGGPGMDGQNPGGADGAPQIGGGRGGPGGGGPGGGGRGGFAGGPGGGFGGGGFGGRGGGGFGGRGGRDGNRGPGGRNMNAFGNGRRNNRMRYNGNVGIIYDNSAMDARQYSLTGQDTAKPATANARMTAMFGGPLKIPHLLSGEKTTFNVNYQFTRARIGNVQSTLVPTADERAGNFGNVLDLQGRPVTIYDPTTGSPFPGNIIPQNRISSQALGLLSFYPLPNFASNNLRYNYQTALVGVTNQDNVNTRISHTINSKNQVNGNFSFQRQDVTSPNLFGFVDSTHQNAYNTGVSWTYHFTTRLFNTASVNFSRNSNSILPYFANRENISGQLGIGGNDQNPNFWGPPTLGFANGFSGLSDGNTSLVRAQTTAFSDSVRWFHDKHNFTFGGDVRRLQNNPIAQDNPRGTFTFTGGNTSLRGVGGFDMADFLLGLPDTSKIAFGNADKYYRNGWFSLFANDDWRLTTKLSLILGLRWDYQLPTTELYGRLVNMSIGPGFTSATPVCATTVAGCTPYNQAGFTKSLLNGDAREFQPRIGFAYRPLTKGSLVIRGGYGLYYNTTPYTSIISQMAQQAPLSYSLIDSSTLVPLTLANGFPVINQSPVTTFAVDPNFRIGYVHTWQMAVQQNLPWSLVATATYSGAKGTHQMQEFIPNSAPPGTTYFCASCPTNFTYLTTGGNSMMNSVRMQLQRRFRSGFSGMVDYVHISVIDEGSAGGRGAAASVAQNWLDLDAERARSSGIRSNTLNAMMQYSTGMGARGGALLKGFKGKLLRDWTITNSFTVAGGAPETPSLSRVALGGTGIIGPLRAEYTGLPVYNPDGTLNPNAFIQPLPGTYGNAGRNTITGPMIFSMNSSAGRIIRVGERKSFDIRVDARNPLNHVVFTNWNTTVGSVQYGLPSAVNPMRSLTATLRFRF